jgi:chromosome segregation ATPase
VWRVVRLLLLVAVLSALTLAVIFGVRLIRDEISRSVENINDRIAAQSERIDGFDRDLDGLFQQDEALEERVRALDAETSGRLSELERQLTGVESRLAVEIEGQGETLATMEARLEAVADDVAANATAVAELGDAAGALQSDIIDTNVRIDELGGELDLLAGDVSAVEGQLAQELDALRADFATPEDRVAEVTTALRYFRVWQLVARARLRLAENNPGLAAFDVESALNAVDELVQSDRQAAVDLGEVRERLALAGANLPEEVLAASRDLEAAWEVLDARLATLLEPELPETPEPVETIPAEEAEPAPEAAPTSTPAPTETPEG